MATVKITVTDQMREDMLVTALEGGSNYWYWLGDFSIKIIEEATPNSKEPFSIRMWEAINRHKKSIPVFDIEDRRLLLGVINLDSISKGEQIMADKHLNHFTDMVNENGDARTADVWFQLSIMKEVVYG